MLISVMCLMVYGKDVAQIKTWKNNENDKKIKKNKKK